MDDFMENLPSMPVVLMTHDVNHRDWTRFTEDLADAWLCRLSLPNQGGRPPKRSTTAINLVELWNWWFFLACDVELTIYNGRERKNGEYAGIIDIPPPQTLISGSAIPLLAQPGGDPKPSKRLRGR